MTTTVVKVIGTGGDYSTPQAWEDATPADLTAVDQIWQGQLKNETFGGTGTRLSIAGTTTDSTRYVELTTQTGASFIDNIGSSALRFDTSNGAVLNTTSNYASAIDNTVAYTRINKVQASTTAANSSALTTTARMTVDRCILTSSNTGAGGVVTASVGTGTAKFTNCLIYNDVSSATKIVATGNNFEAYNCTFAVPSDRTAATYGLDGSYTNGTIKNCAIFGATNTDEHGNSTFTYTTCYTDSASPPTGVTQVAYDTTTGSGFEGKTAGTFNVRIKSTSALKDTGTTDATNAPTDILGTSRAQGAGYDVGCHELIVASAPTLSAATVTSITSTGATPRVTITF